MIRRLVVRAEAEGDLLDAARWYERRRPGLGQAFVLSVDAALASIVESPLSFPVLL